ncbi:MAG: hypothetical protein NT037_18680 [Hyphomicrobiales bacterium]|jgi:hypothetical protein|nr:hypothetical protein [Hyphomicrobiales bacterium]
MKLLVVVGATAAIVLAAVVGAQPTKLMQTQSPVVDTARAGSFEQVCQTNFEQIYGTIKRQEGLSGKIPYTVRARVASVIPAFCVCTRDMIGGDVTRSELMVMGKLSGALDKTKLAEKYGDAGDLRAAQADARQQIEKLMNEHQYSLNKMGALAGRLETAQRTCSVKHFR